jgi:hypothetical protein
MTDLLVKMRIMALLNMTELFFFNSVFHPTKNIPPRLLGETGVRKHLKFI